MRMGSPCVPPTSAGTDCAMTSKASSTNIARSAAGTSRSAACRGEYRNLEGYHRFAREASEVAEALAGAGLTFSYHNHDFELERYGSKTGLEILIDESDSRLDFEIDTYWVQHGGGDPAAWIRRVSGRIPLVHLKDMTVKGGQVRMAEVGEGNLNWPAILEACREAGVEWYIIEQDICDRDPFESLAISLKNVKAMGLGS